MKKLAIFLSVALLVSAVLSMGLTQAAAADTVIFESDFDALPEGIVTTTAQSAYHVAQVSDGVFNSISTTYPKVGNSWWKCVFQTDPTAIPLKWDIADTQDANGRKYKVEMDWEITVPTLRGDSSELRMLIYAGASARPLQPTIFKGAYAAGTKGSFSEEFLFNGPDSAFTSNSETGQVDVYFDLRAMLVPGFKITKFKITDLTPSADSAVLIDTNFASIPEGVTTNYSNHYLTTTDNGYLNCTYTSHSSKKWSSSFKTDKDAVPMTWEPTGDNKYKIEFDWKLMTDTMDKSSEMRVIVDAHDAAGDVRAATNTLFKGATKATADWQHFEWIVDYNGTAGDKLTTDVATTMTIVTMYVPGFVLDNFKITDVTPAPAPAEKAVEYKGLQAKEAPEGAEVTALRFGFDLKCTGVTKDDNHRRVIADNATVTVDGAEYKLVDFGALLSTNEAHDLSLDSTDDIYGIRAYNLYEVADGVVTYTVGVANMPIAQPDKMLYARAFVIYELADGTQQTVYSDAVSGCLNDVEV